MLKILNNLPLILVFFLFAKVSAAKPNIIYIMTDDHSYQTIAAYGGMLKDIVKTPNMDSLAKEGILFERCYVTNSLCGPARATVLTGKHSHANGFFANTAGQVFDGSQITFPKVLQQNGYQTAIVGKWHLHSDPTGFDYWEVLPGQGRYYNPIFIKMDGTKVTEKGYNSDLIVDKSLEWLKNRDTKKPFMIMIHFKGVHSEWEPALRHANMYDDIKFPVSETFFDDYSTRASPAKNQAMQISRDMENSRLRLDNPPSAASDEEKKMWQIAFAKKDKEFFENNKDEKSNALLRYQRFMQNYCATVAGVDENIGRVLKFLKDNNLDEDTLVIYTSDQGFYMGEHGWYDKRFMYEEAFKTPLIMRWKGKIKENVRTNAMVQNLDFAETILDVAGCKIPEEMQGVSLKNIILNGGNAPANWRNSVYYRYYEWPGSHMVMRHEGVIMDNEKLINFYPIKEIEYYNLSLDPKELENKANDSASKPRIAALQTELERLRKLYNAPDYSDECYEKELLDKAIKLWKDDNAITLKDIKTALKKSN